jgi:hypothetical protein
MFEASLGKWFERLYLEKNPSQKRAAGVAQGVGPEFKSHTAKKKKKKFGSKAYWKAKKA